MRLSEAIGHLDLIQEHLTRSEVFRGYRPLPIAISGAIGLLAGALQPWLTTGPEPMSFLYYWLAVGVLSGLAALGPTLVEYLDVDSAFHRRQTRHAIGQFLPCLIAGGIVTIAIATTLPDGAFVQFLPGLWAILFGLGIVASRPYLPRTVRATAWFYLGAGGIALCLAARVGLSGWTVAIPFGVGQLLVAWSVFAAEIQQRINRHEEQKDSV